MEEKQIPVQVQDQVQERVLSTVHQPPTTNHLPASSKLSKLPNLPNLSKVPKKALLVIPVVLLVLFLLILSISLMGGGNGGIPGIIPVSSPAASISPNGGDGLLSPYAEDPEVKEIDQGIKNLETKLNNVELREDTLRIPILDWDVNFNK